MDTDAVAERVTHQDTCESRDLDEIVAGLAGAQKALSPKYFYDQRGSQLFDEITRQPEYYPTRTELAIMRANTAGIVAAVGPQASLIEFGSGSSLKTRLLLEHLDSLAVYVPVDISLEHLVEATEGLQRDFPNIEMLPVAADFTHPFDLPEPRIAPLRNVVYFPGSTIGNFPPAAADSLLRVMRHEARDGGALLIGVDLQKSVDVLERAYNDAAGVTAEFNLNMLRRLNREFGADFDLDAFRHRAIYNEPLGRIEMHLVSQRAQTVDVGGHSFRFERGEYILSETSHKYTLSQFAAMAERAGFRVATVWTDDDDLFSLQYCETLPVD